MGVLVMVFMWLHVTVKRMQEIIASMSGSRLDALSGHYRQRVLEERLGEDDSGTSSTELRRVSPVFTLVLLST